MILLAIDPNEKAGLMGVGSAHVVSSSGILHYTIYFENLPAATAPAQEVFIVDDLDSNLDWASLRFQEIAFGDVTIAADTGYKVSGRRMVVDYRPDVSKRWWVDVTGDLDTTTGRVTWTLRTLDPETGDLPEDPLAGFLPPEDGTGRGQGYVRFSVRPRSDVPFGTRIANRASITFDTNDPIVTNEVWNTVDALADLAVTLSGSSDPVATGKVLTYTITVRNKGPQPAPNVVVTDTLPLSVTLAATRTSQGTCDGSVTIICQMGTLDLNSNATITVAVLPTVSGTLSNSIAVASSVLDPDLENNGAIISTTVIQAGGDLFLPAILNSGTGADQPTGPWEHPLFLPSLFRLQPSKQ